MVAALSRARGPGRVGRSAFLQRSSVAELPFAAAEHSCWSSFDGRVQYASWSPARVSPADPPRTETEVIDEAGVTAFAGMARPVRGTWPAAVPAVVSLRAAVEREGFDPPPSNDAFCVFHLRSDGSGCVAGDVLGIHTLHVAESEGDGGVGNRPDLVATTMAERSGRPVERDHELGAVLAHVGFGVGSRTGFRGVRALVDGERVVADAAGARVVRPSVLPWEQEGSASLGFDELVDAAIDQIADALRHALARSPGRPQLQLTGGKDSRLVLAVAMLTGLAHEFTTTTGGPPGLEDRRVAAAIAERFGLDHEVSVGEAPSLDLRTRFATHTHRTCGAASCWDVSTAAAEPTLVVSGLAGEMLRSNFYGNVDLDHRHKMIRRFTQLPYGRAGLLRPEAEREVRAELLEVFLDGEDRSAWYLDQFDLFYLRHRQPRWLGSRIERFSNKVMALHAPFVISANFRLPAGERAGERLHRAIITRASPDLAAIDFADDRWRDVVDATPMPPPGERSSSLPAELPGPAPSRPSKPKRAMNAQEMFRSARTAERAAAVGAVFADADPDNPAFERIDRAACLDAAARYGDLDSQQRSQLLGAVTAVLWAGHHETHSSIEWPS